MVNSWLERKLDIFKIPGLRAILRRGEQEENKKAGNAR